MTIYAGDTPLLKFTLRDSLGPVDLSTGTLKLVMKNNATRLEKTGLTVTDAINGKCEIRLAPPDLTAGECSLQPIITYTDGRDFAFSKTAFTVEARL